MTSGQPEDRAELIGPPDDSFERIHEPLAFWARHRPDAPAISENGVARSYAELEADVALCAGFLSARGVGAGDRVMILMENGLAGVTLLLAASKLGAWAVPVNARLSPREVEAISAHAGPRITLYTVGNSLDARAHADREDATSVPELEAIGAAYRLTETDVRPEQESGPWRDRVAALLYTSGTTGAPKGVMLTHGNLLFVARRTSRIRQMHEDDRVYLVLPISHVFGLAAVLVGNLYRGTRIDLAPRFVPDHVARALAEDEITLFHGVPAMYSHLLSLARQRGAPLAAPGLRYMSTGGAPLDLALKQEMEEMFRIPLHNGYGMTETSATVSTMSISGSRDDDSVGTLLPDTEIRIADERGAELPYGEIGDLWIRGGLIMKGYYRDPGQTAEVLTDDGWFKTGDLARQIADGHLYIVGRRKELIIRSGFNVYPVEVEGVLAGHPDVALVAVIGRPRDGNEEVVAFIQPRPGASPDPAALAAFAADRLAPYKRPARYIIREQLPATAANKIQKHKLKLELEGDRRDGL